MPDPLSPSPVEAERTETGEITRLRAWLRLIEAEGGDGYEHAYYALHGYDAPKAEHIERVRKVPENLHPAEREAWEARRV